MSANLDHQQESYFFPKLMLGISLISLATLSAGLCDFVPIKLNLEIMFTANMLFVAMACLRQFYLDLQIYHDKENAMTMALIDQLQTEHGEHPSRTLAWSVLKEKLEKEPNYIIRIKTLSDYQDNPSARAELIKVILEEQAEIEVLEMLGLRLGESKNEILIKQQA